MLINRRGISPLIATVLIIGITIILVTTVAFWLIPMFGEATCESSCDLDSISLCSVLATGLAVETTDANGDEELDTTVVTNGVGETYNFKIVYRDESGSMVGEIINASVGPYSGYNEEVTEDTATTVDVIPFVTPDASDGCPECQEIQCNTMTASLV